MTVGRRSASPKAFRLPGSSVFVEKRVDCVVLRPQPSHKVKSLGDVARHMAALNPSGAFPDRGRQGSQDRDLAW